MRGAYMLSVAMNHANALADNDRSRLNTWLAANQPKAHGKLAGRAGVSLQAVLRAAAGLPVLRSTARVILLALNTPQELSKAG